MYVFTIDTIFSFAEHRTRTPLASSEYSKLSSKKKPTNFPSPNASSLVFFLPFCFPLFFSLERNVYYIKDDHPVFEYGIILFLFLSSRLSFFLPLFFSLSYVGTLIPICYRCSRSCTCSDNIGITM